jgi:predicted small lipoprotein YifL
MKKTLSLILAALMFASSLASCGKTDPVETNRPETNAPETNEPETDAPAVQRTEFFGVRTDVGAATNNYTIDWGTANRSNYEVSEDLGTLTVTPASVTVTTGSAEKEYDGTPLTSDEASISGLVNGETAAVTATGSITEVGSTANTYSIRWGSADSSNYDVSEQLGTLRVTGRAPRAEVTLTAASARKTYDGNALTDSSCSFHFWFSIVSLSSIVPYAFT